MSDQLPLCVLCEKPVPAESPNKLLCKKHWEAAKRETKRLEKEYQELMRERKAA